MIKGMIEYRKLAARARCRVTAWRLTEVQALQLATELQGTLTHSIFTMVAMMKRGDARLFGARVIVV